MFLERMCITVAIAVIAVTMPFVYSFALSYLRDAFYEIAKAWKLFSRITSDDKKNEFKETIDDLYSFVTPGGGKPAEFYKALQPFLLTAPILSGALIAYSTVMIIYPTSLISSEIRLLFQIGLSIFLIVIIIFLLISFWRLKSHWKVMPKLNVLRRKCLEIENIHYGSISTSKKSKNENCTY
jgi:hypothetical protein